MTPNTFEAVGWEKGTLERSPVEEATEPLEAVLLPRIPLSAMFGIAGFTPFAVSLFFGGLVILRPLVAERVVSLDGYTLSDENRSLVRVKAHSRILATWA